MLHWRCLGSATGRFCAWFIASLPLGGITSSPWQRRCFWESTIFSFWKYSKCADGRKGKQNKHVSPLTIAPCSFSSPAARQPGEFPCSKTRRGRLQPWAWRKLSESNFQRTSGLEMAVVVKTMGSHFGVGEFTTHFRAYFTGIGMFTGGTGF